MIRRIVFVVIILAFTLHLKSQAEWQWANKLNGTGYVWGGVICNDDNYNTYIAGDFSDTLIVASDTLIASDYQDSFIAMLSPGGIWQWGVQISTPGNTNIQDIAIDNSGNLCVMGMYDQSFALGSFTLTNYGIDNIFIGKLSPARQWIAAIGYASLQDNGNYSFSVAPDGSVYAVGEFYQTVSFGSITLSGTLSSTYLVKFDASLNPIWAIQPNSHGDYAEFYDVGCDNLGNVYVQGSFGTHCTFPGTPTIDIVSTANDAFVSGFDANGHCLWAEQVGLGYHCTSSADVDVNGNSYISCDVVGSFYRAKNHNRLDADVNLAKFNSQGICQWYKTRYTFNYSTVSSIAGDNEGNCYVSGCLWGTYNFGPDLLQGTMADWNQFVAKASPTGDWIWGLQTYFGNTYTKIRDIVTVESGNCIVVGSYSGVNLDFGNIVFPAPENASVFVAKAGTSTIANDYTVQPPKMHIRTYPNPTSDNVFVEFELDKTQSVKFWVFNVKGQLVSQQSYPNLEKGMHKLVWDSTAIDRKTMGSGVYVVKVETESEIASRLVFKK